MSRLPVVNARKLSNILKKLGFQPVRQRGSHIFFRHSDGRTTIVPFHAGEEIGRNLLNQIIREIGLTPEEFSRHI